MGAAGIPITRSASDHRGICALQKGGYIVAQSGGGGAGSSVGEAAREELNVAPDTTGTGSVRAPKSCGQADAYRDTQRRAHECGRTRHEMWNAHEICATPCIAHGSLLTR
jgi:hypothetical protein